MGRGIYTGIYEPGHPTSDAEGFRGDVLDLVRELGVSTVRYPGGNFVSGFRWEDSVGPRETRPTRLNLAWHSTETNEVGLHEFASWLRKIDAELMLAVNLGTRGILEALDLLEYTNVPAGTAQAEARARNGQAAPFDVRIWCLGNEMDGPWQLGHGSADDYGKLAAQTAKAMRQVDPTLELVVCGSSGAQMPTFGHWERTILHHAYEDVDLVSCHAYYEEVDGDLGSFLASGVDMDRFIDEVVAICDEVKAEKRTDHEIDISFDEWNVWYQSNVPRDTSTAINDWPLAPRLSEEAYTVADAVVVGGLLISLLNHVDRVKSASLAQLVNVIAPIGAEPGGPAWRKSTFFPFAATSRLAHGRALRVEVEADLYRTDRYGLVPLIDAAATVDDESGRSAIFLVNRSVTEEVQVTVDIDAAPRANLLDAQTLTERDPHAANTAADPLRVALKANPSAVLEDGLLTVVLPPTSWTCVELGVARS
jgi:alpha-N-arabinofuranosidase